MKRPSRPGGQRDHGECWTRRRFVKALAAAAGGGILAGGCAGPGRGAGGGGGAGAAAGPKRVALLATEVRRHSHAQHFIDRLLEGYGWEGRWRHPAIELVSLYVDQFPERDLARERSRRFGVPILASVEEALTLGGSRLAVDGVLIIAEHGKYPRNEKGQTLYPRHAWFERTVKVFEESGRAVPVFNDKHLSTAWDECAAMVDASRRLGFPFLAGSSLPVTWRIPSIEMPSGAPLVESLCACYGGVDSYDFHGLETAQCMSERRAGGETGVESVLALRGERAWAAIEEREATRLLLLAALSRSHTLAAPEGYTFPVPGIAWARGACPDAIAYFIEHRGGFRTVMLLLNGLVRDFTYAGLLRSGETVSCQMHLPMPGHISTTADFFNPLLHNIERTVVEGRTPYPVERTLLTSGMTLFAVESLHGGGARVATPGMREVAYRAPAESAFWRS